MEAKPTASGSKKTAKPPSTADPSSGLRYERCAQAYCRRKRYHIVKQNWNLGWGEIDVLATAPDGTCVLIEVRGRRQHAYRASRYFPYKKRVQLRRLGKSVARRYGKSVRIELLEVVGPLPTSAWFDGLLAWFPEWFGLRLRAYRIR